MGRREIVVGVIGVLLLASASVWAQRAAPPTKFVTPLKGEAQVQILNPQSKQEGNIYVTRIKVKNVSKGPLIGFKADEYWYSAKGDTVSGSPTFRHPKPFMPGEVIEVVLRSPWNTQMSRNLRVFAHLNGSVKATIVKALKADS